MDKYVVAAVIDGRDSIHFLCFKWGDKYWEWNKDFDLAEGFVSIHEAVKAIADATRKVRFTDESVISIRIEQMNSLAL